MSDNISEALGMDDLAPIDESTLPEAGSDEANELEGSYDLSEPPGDDETPDPDADTTGRKQLVPLGALQEERTKRQERERELEETRASNQRMQERFNEMMMRLQGVQLEKPAEQEEVIPDFNDDPAGHVEGLKRQFGKQLAELQQSMQQTQGHTQQQQQVQYLAQQATIAEDEFRKTAPDYDLAADYFRTVKMAEYEAIGLDPLTAQQQLARDCTGLVQLATQQKVNPAEKMYKLAKALGYKPNAAPKPNGAPTAAAPKARMPTSLATANGAPRAPDEDGGGMSLEKVANMSDAEFDKFFKEMGKGTIQRPKY